MSDKQHHIHCDYWCDQYPWECTCGLTMPKADWFNYEDSSRRDGDMPIIFDISPKMIEQVWAEWRKETGRDPRDMTPRQFADRMMVKVRASAQMVSQDEFDAAKSEKH